MRTIPGAVPIRLVVKPLDRRFHRAMHAGQYRDAARILRRWISRSVVGSVLAISRG